MSRGRGQDFRVTIVSAKNVRAADVLGGKSDPYCVCEVVGRPNEKKQKTHSVNNTTDPKWNYTFEVKNCTGVEHLKFSVYDSDWDSDDPLGTATMAASLYFRPEGFEGELPLVDKEARSAAFLKVRVVPVNGGSNADSPARSPAGSPRGPVAGALPPARPGAYNRPGAQSPAGSPRGPVAGAQPPARPGAYNRVEAMSRGRGQDFRITIVSAKNLRAADILGGKSDPYCVCEVVGRPNEKKQKTHAVSNTTDPKWNYTFEVKNCTGVEHLKFSVYDSDWDSDDPLGTATMAASLYFRPEGFDGELNLVDKEARSAAFLKVRVVPVNGGSNADSLAHPGAQSPAGSPRGPVAGAQPPARPGAYNRVEAMSRGRGQDFRITIVSAKNLRAADILGGKSDPYCVCEVVGRPDEKKQKTHTVNNSTDPKWNYTFEVKNCTGVEHLKFSVYDSDWDSDDPLGTATMASSLYFRPEGFDGELDLVDQDARSAALLKVRVVPVKGGSGAQSPAGSSQGGRRPPRPLGIEHSLNEGVELADKLEERAAKLQENFKQAQDSIVSMDRLFEEADACIKKSQTTLNRTAKRIHDLTIRASSLNLGQDAHHVQEDFGEAVHQPEIRSRRGKVGRSARAAMPQLR